VRRGFTLMEVVIVLLIGFVVIVTAYQVMHLMVDAEKTTDKASQRAITEARLTEQLLRDLRSSHKVAKESNERYVISRYVNGSPRMESRDVTWRVEKGTKVVREATGEGRQEFPFDGLLDPDEPAFKFRLDKAPDAEFTAIPSVSPAAAQVAP
jgi:prepilin-type N-terminal cleavage/methylation domain-containing protein